MLIIKLNNFYYWLIKKDLNAIIYDAPKFDNLVSVFNNMEN